MLDKQSAGGVEDAQLSKLWQQAAATGALGLGVGAAGRGLLGLYQMINRAASKPPRSSYSPLILEVPEHPEEEKQATSTLDHWAGLPALTGAAVGGGMGGWKLVDYLLDKKRKADDEEELATVKRQYENALLGKKASELGGDLDDLCDAIQEKQAELPSMGMVAGTGLTVAGLLALLGAKGGYSMGKSRQEASVIDKARDEHERDIAATRAPDIYAKPVRVSQPRYSKRELALQALQDPASM